VQSSPANQEGICVPDHLFPSCSSILRLEDATPSSFQHLSHGATTSGREITGCDGRTGCTPPVQDIMQPSSKQNLPDCLFAL
jgi:hypothetical protein